MGLLVRAAAIAAGLVLTVPTTAHAARYDHTDASGDVAKCGDTACTSVAYASTQEPDIRRVSIQHRLHKVVVQIAFAEIRRTASRQGFGMEVLTDESVRRTFTVEVEGPTVRTWFSRPSGLVSCSGLERKIDFTANTVMLAIPRTCLGGPAWVRVGVGAYAAVGDALRADDALRRSMDPSAVTLTKSPRITRD